MTKLNIKHRQTDGCAREEGDVINVLKQNRYQKLTSPVRTYCISPQFNSFLPFLRVLSWTNIAPFDLLPPPITLILSLWNVNLMDGRPFRWLNDGPKGGQGELGRVFKLTPSTL